MHHLIEIVSIEGNIGSGKSTLLANLKNNFKYNKNIIFLKEPLDEWNKIKDENGTTILEKFYNNKEKYSFSFQMMAYISRLKLLKDTIDEIKLKINQKYYNNNGYFVSKQMKFIIITERSLFTDKMVFAKMLYDNGMIENINYQIYLNWFNTFANEFPINKIIYVKAHPETCYQRIYIRNRDGENNISINYLKSCNDYHENMLDNNSCECVCKNLIVLDGNHNIYENEDILKEWISLIEKFIYN